MPRRGKGGKGLGKGGAKRHHMVLRYCDSNTQDLLGERDSLCYDPYRARLPQDCYCHGCCLCFKEAV